MGFGGRERGSEDRICGGGAAVLRLVSDASVPLAGAHGAQNLLDGGGEGGALYGVHLSVAWHLLAGGKVGVGVPEQSLLCGWVLVDVLELDGTIVYQLVEDVALASLPGLHELGGVSISLSLVLGYCLRVPDEAEQLPA